jgi:hypothetical protein
MVEVVMKIKFIIKKYSNSLRESVRFVEDKHCL